MRQADGRGRAIKSQQKKARRQRFNLSAGRSPRWVDPAGPKTLRRRIQRSLFPPATHSTHARPHPRPSKAAQTGKNRVGSRLQGAAAGGGGGVERAAKAGAAVFPQAHSWSKRQASKQSKAKQEKVPKWAAMLPVQPSHPNKH